MDGQNFWNDPNQSNEVYVQNAQNNQNNGPTPTLAIVSLVMGIISILLGCCYGVGIIFAIAGIVMSVIASRQQKSGVGIAGLVCSIVGAVFSVIMIAYFAVVVSMLLNDADFMNQIRQLL